MRKRDRQSIVCVCPCNWGRALVALLLLLKPTAAPTVEDVSPLRRQSTIWGSDRMATKIASSANDWRVQS